MAVLAGSGPWIWRSTGRWRQQTDDRLQAGSAIVEPALGPIECATAGRGAPLLVFHGAPVGYDQALALADLQVVGDQWVIARS